MIDLHTHILPFIDDGSESLEQSLSMVEAEVNAGVTDIVLTPHYRFKYSPEKSEILSGFNQLKQAVEQRGLKVNLYLGQEIYADKNIKKLLSEDKVFTINGTKYILVEFSLDYKCDIPETVYELKRLGYNPIVAHIERYFYADIHTLIEVKNYGGLVQVNASSIVGKHKRSYLKLIKQAFKYGLIDIVASDIHSFRQNEMAKCYKKVSKKFGERVAEIVFIENAKKILKG